MTNSRHTVLYVGVTSDLPRRVWEHRHGTSGGFSSRYLAWKLVWYESCSDIRGAIEREKQLKAGRRSRKVQLIEATNPNWDDLAAEWLGPWNP